MRRMLSFILIFVLLFSMFIIAQAIKIVPEISWIINPGGSSAETLQSAQHTADGGYITADYSESVNGEVTGNNGGSDNWIAMLENTAPQSVGAPLADIANQTQILKDDITKLNQDTNGFPVAIHVLPNGVKDTLVNNEDGTYTLTQNIKEITLTNADIYDIVKTTKNVDYVRIYKPLDYIGYDNGGSISGRLKLEGLPGDKAYADNAVNIGYVSSFTGNFFGAVVAKGTYTDVSAARSALVGKKVTYQLAAPIVYTINNKSVLKPWAGKTANFLGDSITEGDTVDGSYVPVVKDLLGLAKANNYSVSGGRLCNVNAEIDALYTPLIDSYTSIDMKADIIFVLIGTNDYVSQVPIGATNSTSHYEFNGALNETMDWFRVNFPSKLVIFSTILHRYNDEQLTIKANEYRDAIRERCEAKHFLCYDAYMNTEFDFAAGYYDHVLTNDGLHPNAAGNTILGRKIAGFINSQ